jgi:hypothetical protein
MSSVAGALGFARSFATRAPAVFTLLMAAAVLAEAPAELIEKHLKARGASSSALLARDFLFEGWHWFGPFRFRKVAAVPSSLGEAQGCETLISGCIRKVDSRWPKTMAQHRTPMHGFAPRRAR